MRVFGLILAGGAGRRMGGRDKGALMLGGQTVLSHVIERFSPQVEELALSVHQAVPDCGLLQLADAAGDRQGPLAGVAAGLRWAVAGGASHLATVAVDTPFLPCDLVARLMLAGDGAEASAASGGRDHPTAALWPVAALARVEAALAGDERRLRHVLAARARAEFAGEIDPFFNLNTPEDLTEAEGHLRAAR